MNFIKSTKEISVTEFAYLGAFGGIIGVAIYQYLDFLSMFIMCILGSILGIIFSLILLVIERRYGKFKKKTIYIFVLAILCSSACVGYFSIYRSPDAAFEEEFGFERPISVHIEHIGTVPCAMDSVILMEFTAPKNVVIQIIDTLNFKQYDILNESSNEFVIIRQNNNGEYKKIGIGLKKNWDWPKWWKLSCLKDVKLYVSFDEKEELLKRIIFWNEDLNKVYYQHNY